ncbi:hypothetical protein BaRGS_00007506 [Batillaria attramentaria]|uniref:G-protein coupled receptors family 1 profile domain-containing protein n=1 Tax=Batillaria attramentaria TaxID=370345 RepID=A0ABD0LQ75_9CAEN
MDFSVIIFAPLAYLLAVWVLLGNGLTILAVFRFEKLRTRANMYIVSLATSDALVGILLFFFGSLYIPSWRPWFDSTEFVCVGMLSWAYVTVVCSWFNMCLIALDRYIYIAQPYLYERYMTEKNIAGAIVTVWVLAFVYGTIPVYYNTFSTSTRCTTREVIPLMYRSFLSAGLFLFCCLCTGALYIKITLITLHQKKNIARVGRENARNYRVDRGSLKALRLFLTVFGCLFICWSPYCFVELVDGYFGVANIWLRSSMLLGFLNSGINFFIYPYFNQEFRQALRVLLCCCKSPQQTSVVDTHTATGTRLS